MHIETVTEKKGLDRFIRFPWAVYEGDPNWVPPLISEMEFVLGEENPFSVSYTHLTLPTKRIV